MASPELNVARKEEERAICGEQTELRQDGKGAGLDARVAMPDCPKVDRQIRAEQVSCCYEWTTKVKPKAHDDSPILIRVGVGTVLGMPWIMAIGALTLLLGCQRRTQTQVASSRSTSATTLPAGLKYPLEFPSQRELHLVCSKLVGRAARDIEDVLGHHDYTLLGSATFATPEEAEAFLTQATQSANTPPLQVWSRMYAVRRPREGILALTIERGVVTRAEFIPTKGTTPSSMDADGVPE